MTAPTLITLPFHGHPLVTFELNGEPHAAMKPIVEGIGLSWQGQLERIKRNPILNEGIRVTRIPSDGGPQEMVALPLRLLNGWLFGIDVERVKPELRETILTYQRECYDALYRYWHEGAAINPRHADDAGFPVTGSPFDNVQAAKLGKLLRTSKSAAQAYLIACGVTPDYVRSTLGRSGAMPPLSPLLAPPGTAVAAPLEHLAHEVPLHFDREDESCWYLLRETLTRICGDYDVTATARMLRTRNLLRYNADSLMVKVYWREHGKLVHHRYFGISKRLVQEAAHA